jgi:predicted RND superfamily exporter protein
MPLTSKDLSYRVYSALSEKAAEFEGSDQFHITGLPVAEDTFGFEMFKQMAISAPLAMLAIFLLMLLFFRKLHMIISPLIVALISVIWTMGLLIITGNTIHIMSSMIPIFIMPIAVLDSIHILSMFFDRYQKIGETRKTMLNVMESLFMAMLYTSLTSAAGFASLALTPIPPVQVFGLFCAFGIMVAWILTITFIPAFASLLPERLLQGFGSKEHTEAEHGILTRLLRRTGEITYRAAVPIVLVTVGIVVIAVYGISRIEINDNPIKWFEPEHPIRVADRVLNDHFAGTYMAYLALAAGTPEQGVQEYAQQFADALRKQGAELREELPAAPEAFGELRRILGDQAATAGSRDKLLEQIAAFAAEQQAAADNDELYFAWEEASLAVNAEQQKSQVFKQPEALEYISKLQEFLGTVHGSRTDHVVGKSNSLADIVKTVHRELFGGDPAFLRIPDSANAVAQCLITFENSHRPQDLWHFVTPDYRRANLWLQLHSGDNVDMERVVREVDRYFAENPPPFGITKDWFGLTYINVVWQDNMVWGMLFAFLGSFLVVFLMMTVLFRSAVWGFLCMVPLTVTIGLIYGTIGLIGKDYDMPTAVLSALALGLAVDFAIHFLEHTRVMRTRYGSWQEAAEHMFGDPARAIARNVIVIAVGFLPLLAAPLVPYQTVGIFLAAILAVSGITTLLLLPALVRLLEKRMFPETMRCCFTCNCITCIASGIALVALVAVNVHQFFTVGLNRLTWLSLAAIPLLALACHLMSKREKCRLEAMREEAEAGSDDDSDEN